MLKIGRNDIPEYKALIYFSVWIGFYIVACIYIPHHLNLIKWEHPKVIGLVLIFSLLPLNYSIFIKNKRYIKIKENFETINKLSKTKGTILITLFLLLPFTQLFYVLIVKVLR